MSGVVANVIAGNDILKWEISGAPAKGVIAIAYIFVGVYGLTWVSLSWVGSLKSKA